MDWLPWIRSKDLYTSAVHEARNTPVNKYKDSTLGLHKATIISKGDSGAQITFPSENDGYRRGKTERITSFDVFKRKTTDEQIVFGKEDVTQLASSSLSKASYIAEIIVK